MMIADLPDVLVGGGLVALAIAVGVLLGWPYALGLLGVVAMIVGLLLGARHEPSGE